jgi:hypothetical protein
MNLVKLFFYLIFIFESLYVFAQNADEVQPYIESLKRGEKLNVELNKKPKKAAGILVKLNSQFNVKSKDFSANSFESVYKPNESGAIGVEVFYEHKLLYHSYLGSLSPIGKLKTFVFKGNGVFTKQKTTSDEVTYHFFAVPISFALSYRFTPLKIMVPFIQYGVSAIPMNETRSDGGKSRRAISAGYEFSYGAQLSLDWISRKNFWETYNSYGFLHSYLIFQHESMRTFQGNVGFNFDTNFLGLMFEF